MGADIYREDSRNSGLPEDLTYFRDSYNDTSVYWVLGLSWWQDVSLIHPSGVVYDDKTGYPVDRDAALERQRVYLEDHWRPAAASFPEKFEEWLAGDRGGAAVGEDGSGNARDDWMRYFEDKIQRWTAMQERAIADGALLSWSV